MPRWVTVAALAVSFLGVLWVVAAIHAGNKCVQRCGPDMHPYIMPYSLECGCRTKCEVISKPASEWGL